MTVQLAIFPTDISDKQIDATVSEIQLLEK